MVCHNSLLLIVAQFLLVATTLVRGAPTAKPKITFVASTPAHKLFNASIKCENPGYREVFSPVDDVGMARANSLIFSQVALVGRIVEVESAAAAGNASYNISVKVDCYLRGEMSPLVVKVLNLSTKKSFARNKHDEHCFPTPPTAVAVGDTVLVLGNVDADQKCLIPVDGGVSTIKDKEANTPTFVGLRCSGEVSFKAVTSPLRAGVQNLCRKHPMSVCHERYFDAFGALRAREALRQFRWNDVKPALRNNLKMNVTSAESVLPEPYFSRDYLPTIDKSKIAKKARISSKGFPKSAVLKSADGSVVFEAASVKQVRYVLRKLGIVGRIMNMLKYELDITLP